MIGTRLFILLLLLACLWSGLVEASTETLANNATRESIVPDIQAHTALRRGIRNGFTAPRPTIAHRERYIPARPLEQPETLSPGEAFLGTMLSDSKILSLTDASTIAQSSGVPVSRHVSFDELTSGHHNVSVLSSFAGDSLYVRFESGILPDLYFPCDAVSDLHFLGARHSPLHFQVFQFPSCFVGHFSILGQSGYDSVELMEDIYTGGKITIDVHSFSVRNTIPCGIEVTSAIPVTAGPAPSDCIDRKSVV